MLQKMSYALKSKGMESLQKGMPEEETEDTEVALDETTAPADAEEQSDGESHDILDDYLPKRVAQVGDIIKGTVVSLTDDYIAVDIGQKAEAVVPLRELRNYTASESLAVGDVINGYVMKSEASRDGITELSIERAQMASGWEKLEEYLESNETVKGKIIDLNRGGIIAILAGVQGFIPLSHLSSPFREIYATEDEDDVDVAKLKKELLEREIEFKVIDFNKRRGRAIFSHRLAVQEERREQKRKLMDSLQEGQTVKGTIVGLSDFGAFVNIGGADGLIHISELSWDQVRKPSAILEVGQELDVYVLKIDHEAQKIALSLKRLTPEPWQQAKDQFVEGGRVKVTITNIVNFGAFARVMPGIEGLIHLSELSHSKIKHPHDVVKEGEVLEVEILNIDSDRKRLGLSLKRTLTKGDGGDAPRDSKSDEADEEAESTTTDETENVADEHKEEPEATAEVSDEAEAQAEDTETEKS